MNANNGTGNNELRDEWKTPKFLFKKLNKQYRFTFDCCAIHKNTKCFYYARNFEYDDRNKLKEDTCWMNPPFSKAWLMFEHFFKVVKTGVAIYRCDNLETRIWQEIIFPNADWIFIPNKRISYEGMEGNGSRFPSALIGYNIDTPKELKGIVLTINKTPNNP